MNRRRKIFGLNLLQVLLVLMGFAVFLATKAAHQKFFLVASINEELRSSIDEKRQFRSTWKFTIAAVLLPLVLVLGRNAASLFYQAARRKRQIKRDLKAAILLDRLRQGDLETFSLYLRSFASEGKLNRKKGLWWYLLFEGDIFLLDRESIESMISAEVHSSCPMIAMGRPGEKLGAGRLPALDDDWRALILFLMDHASFILTIPSTSEGVLWEMDIMTRQFSEKAIYVMPPRKYYRDQRTSAEKAWQETRTALLSRSIFLPEYSPQGALFMLDSKNRLTASCQFEAPFFGGTRLKEILRHKSMAFPAPQKGM